MTRKNIPQSFIDIAEALTQRDMETADSWFDTFTALLTDRGAIADNPAIRDFLITGFLAGLATGRWQGKTRTKSSPFTGKEIVFECDTAECDFGLH